MTIYRVYLAKTLYYITEIEAESVTEAERLVFEKGEDSYVLDDEEIDSYLVEKA